MYKYFVDGIPVERTVDGANNSFTFEKDGEPRQILGIYEFYHIHLVSETGIFYTTYTNLSVNFNINLSKDWIALYLTPLEGTEQKHVYQTELTGVLCLPSADSDFIHIVIIVVSVIAVLMLLALVFCVVRRRRKKGMRILNDISEMPDTIIAVHSDVVPVDKYPRTDLTEIPKSTIEGNVATASKSKSKASSSPRSRGINEVRSSSSASTGANKDATLLVSRSGSPVRKAHSGPKATRTPAQKSPSKAKTRSGVKTPSRAKTGSGARVRSPSGAKKVAKS